MTAPTSPFPTIEASDAELVVGGIIHATVSSPALGGRADCTLWSPPDTGESLGLVILLHGVYGSHWAWAGRGAADRTAAELIATGRVAPFALAMPSDGMIGLGSGYVADGDADVPAWILDEVPVLAALLIPGVDASRPVGLIGLSMGGFGALRLAAVAGPRVAAACGLSSITELSQMALFGARVPDAADETERSVLAAVEGRRGTLPALRLDCGEDDLLFAANLRLHGELSERSIDHEWAVNPGGHEWPYWRRHLRAALEFVSRRLG